MKEGSEVFSCVFVCSVCVCVCEWRVGLALIQLCLWVLAKMGNDHQLSLHLQFLGLWLRATNFRPPCSLEKKKKKVPRVCGRWIFPSWSLLRHFFRGLRSLQTSGCSFMLLCLRNHVTMYLPHTVFISMLLLICTKVSRGNWRVHYWNTCIWKKKIQPFFMNQCSQVTCSSFSLTFWGFGAIFFSYTPWLTA